MQLSMGDWVVDFAGVAQKSADIFWLSEVTPLLLVTCE